MTWKQALDIFRRSYPAEFLRWFEQQFNVDTATAELPEWTDVLNRGMREWSGKTTASTDITAPVSSESDTEMRIEPITGKWQQRQKDNNGEWGRWAFVPSEFQPPSPEEVAQTQADRTMAVQDKLLEQYNTKQALEQRQQELVWNRSEQAMRNAAAQWGREAQAATFVNAEPNTPVNWINYWKAGQEAAKKQAGVEEKNLAINQFAANLTPEQITRVGQTYNPQTIGQYQNVMPQPREGIDPATGQKVQWLSADQITQMWDPFTQSYRPETDQEYQYRIAAQGVNTGVLLAPQALWRQPNLPTALKTPQWATGVLQNSGANIALSTLGGQGNTVRPVSAQMYESWRPSERQGYQGLAEAQKGVYWPDYQANIERMWGASRPGELARQRPWSY